MKLVLSKNKVAFSKTGMVMFMFVFGFIGLRFLDSSKAVTDTCLGVATAFNATAPASVTAGQSFTLSGINSKPATSYGYTINSSTLNMSATNASETSYSKVDTSTDPSPTTGAPTYTAYYPNWTLTATGSAGTTISIKLVSAIADVQGVGQILCPLSATLADINIIAASSSGGSSGSSGSSSSSGSTSSNSSPSSSTGASTDSSDSATATSDNKSASKTSAKSNDNTDTTTNDSSTNSSSDFSSVIQPVTITVKDSKGNPVEGAVVTIDNDQSITTGTDGKATFDKVVVGGHVLGISFNGQTITRDIQVSSQDDNELVQKLPPSKNLTKYLVFGGPALLLGTGAGAYIFIRKRGTKFKLPFIHSNINQPSQIIPNPSNTNTAPSLQTPPPSEPLATNNEPSIAEQNIIPSNPDQTQTIPKPPENTQNPFTNSPSNQL